VVVEAISKDNLSRLGVVDHRAESFCPAKTEIPGWPLFSQT
jgi:hypothetical protein